MKLKKYCLYALVGLILLGVCTGCGKKENENNEELVGGYTISNSVAGTIPENAKTAFENATKDEAKYEVLALMGTQVVAGTNYMFLAKEDDKLVVVVVYEDLNKNATITKTVDFKLIDYLNDNKNITEANLAGGWHVSTEGSLDKMPQELASAWSESFSDYKEINLEPLACLGTQVVAGTNYAMLSRGTNENGTSLYVAVMYNNLENHAVITTVSSIDMSSLITE